MRAGFCRKPLNQWFEQQTEDEPTQLPTGAPRSGNQGVTARPVRDPGGCSRPDRSSSYFEDQTENKIQGRWWVSLAVGAPYWSYSAYVRVGEIVDGQEVNVGAIAMPTRNVTALTRLRTAGGENPAFAVGMNGSAKRTVNGITYSVMGMRYDG